jgi:hypothetical protein
MNIMLPTFRFLLFCDRFIALLISTCFHCSAVFLWRLMSIANNHAVIGWRSKFAIRFWPALCYIFDPIFRAEYLGFL